MKRTAASVAFHGGGVDGRAGWTKPFNGPVGDDPARCAPVWVLQVV